jgi:hypothetical protein
VPDVTIHFSGSIDPSSPCEIRNELLEILQACSGGESLSHEVRVAVTNLFRTVYRQLPADHIAPTLAYIFRGDGGCEPVALDEDEDEDFLAALPPEVLALLARLLASKS